MDGLVILLGLLVILMIGLIGHILWLKGQASTQAQKLFTAWREQEIETIRQQQKDTAQREAFAKIQEQASQQAQEYYRSWREKDFESVRKEQSAIAQREAITNLERWKSEHEQSISQGAIKKSQNVITGKVTEQLIPYLPNFRYNPKDARFIGSPVDFLVFDGLDEGEVKQVVFIEVKTGTSSLSTRQRQIRGIIEARKVKWEELRVDHSRTITSPKPPQAPSGGANSPSRFRAYSQAENYEVGETISHDTFGAGRVI